MTCSRSHQSPPTLLHKSGVEVSLIRIAISVITSLCHSIRPSRFSQGKWWTCFRWAWPPVAALPLMLHSRIMHKDRIATHAAHSAARQKEN